MKLPVSPESLLNALYETHPDPVLIIDADRKFIASNAAASKVFGYSAEEFLELGPPHFYASVEDARAVGEEFFPLNNEPKRVHRRLNFLRRDRSVIPVELTANTIKGLDGEAIGLVVMLRDLSETVEAQEERLRAESILNTALASISEGFVVFDEQDRMVLCNDAYRAIYQLTAPAMQFGTTFKSILSYGLEHGQYPEAGDTPETREAWLQERLAQHNNPGEPILQQIGPDRWLQIEERVTAENYRVGVRTDVSALLRIKSEAERLGRIIESVAQEVYLVRLNDRRFVYANKSARDNLQYSMDELRELDPQQINVDSKPNELAEKAASIISGKTKVLIADTELRRKDGTTYFCRVQMERMDDVSEPVILVRGEDITDRLEIERALARKEREFETLVQNLPDFLTRAKPDTTLTYINGNYARFIGKPAEDIVGEKFLEFIPQEDLEGLMEHLHSLSPENPIRTSEQAMVGLGGEKLWYSWSNLMVFENGEPVELVSVGRDITEIRKAQNRIAAQSRALELRNTALEQFSGIVSHDLKAPLRQIRLFSDMIAEDVSEGRTVDLETFSGHISDRSKAMERMVSNLLEYSKLAYQAINPEKFGLSEAVSTAWENLAVIAVESQAILISEDDILVDVDRDLMIQLFQNLFANSMKYCEPDKPVTIRVNAEVGHKGISIVVEDSGIGIDPVESERIFGVFQRLHKDEKQYPGSGIGLSLCRRIVQSHGGSIVLDPSYQGGARFVITLPPSTG